MVSSTGQTQATGKQFLVPFSVSWARDAIIYIHANEGQQTKSPGSTLRRGRREGAGCPLSGTELVQFHCHHPQRRTMSSPPPTTTLKGVQLLGGSTLEH